MGERNVFTQSIGSAIREARGEATQDRVAQEARALGLASWHRSTVANIERGVRGLTAEELLLLPLILTAATGEKITLPSLLVRDLALTRSLTMRSEAVGRLLAGKSVAMPGHVPLRIREAEALLEGWNAMNDPDEER